MVSKRVIGVLISGSGSNLQAMINACGDPDYPVVIGVVISNKDDAYGLKRAQEANIPTAVINHKDYATREAFDKAMDAVLKAHAVTLVCMAGFMRLVSPWFVKAWHNRLLNIHPSLLPAFKGVNAQQQALDCGVKITGCTVHFVRPEMDAGPIIMQIAVPVKAHDTAEQLRDRILVEEHRCYVEALRLVASGSVVVRDEKVVRIH